jgi:heavy metal sensor kinase
MRSIRLSLMVYFLVLLALGLGSISVLSYRRTEWVQKGRADARQELLRERYDEDRKAERAKLDNLLLNQAWYLAGHAQFKYPDPLEAQLYFDLLAPLASLNMPVAPTSPLVLPVWYTDRSQYGDHMHPSFRFRSMLAQIEVSESSMPKYSEEQALGYFQINTVIPSFPQGKKKIVAWYSRSMEDDVFPFDEEKFVRTDLVTPTFDDTELEVGVPLRRVTLKASIAQVKYRPRPVPLFPSSFSQRRAARTKASGADAGERASSEKEPERPRNIRPPPSEPKSVPSPSILIQCAALTDHRDAALAALDADLATKLDELTAESRTNLAEMRNQLLLISLALFSATVVGGFWLVRLGLSPLKRLSEAVSRISTKDFALALDERPLPGELRPIADRLSETLKLLERAFAREKQAAADISHELRTPLAALLTTLEVGLRKNRSPEEYREMLNDCYGAGKQMSQLVERLLALARLDAGVDTLRPQSMDINHLVEQCASLVRPLADARGLQIQVRRNGPIQCRTDPIKLREVLTNLLHNAIEYNRPAGRVEVGVTQENGQLNLEVSDTGIGIAPDAFAHLFERFYRADPARQADGLHAGLGLAIVKGYVDLMSGTISVQSKEGEGTTFRVCLPIEPTSPKKHS